MNIKRIIFYCIGLLFNLNNVDAQNPYYKSHNLMSGFPCITIYDVHQSKSGLIWFATDVGLFNYDGFDVKNIVNNYPVNKGVTNILEDGAGKIWCQNFKGTFYYTYGDSLIIEPSISHSQSFYAAQMFNKNILASVTKNGVNLFNTQNNTSKFVSIPSHKAIVPTYNDNDNLVINSIEGKTQYVINYKGELLKKKYDIFQTVYSTRFNLQLISITKGFPYQVIFENGTVKTLPFNKSNSFYVNNIKAISNNRLAICTTNGLYILDSHFNIINPNGFYTDVNVSNIIEDTEGNFWISSLNKGLLFTNQLTVLFDKPEYVFSNVCHNNRTLYFGTLENTIIKMDLSSRKLDTIFYSPLKHIITNLLFNKKKQELVFTNLQFNILNTLTKSAISLNIKANDVDTLDATHYVIAHNKGLSIYPNDNSDIVNSWKKSYSTITENAISITKPEEHYFVLSLNNHIYASNTKGLFEYSPSGVKKLTYNNEPLNINNLGVINNELVVITYNVGILKYSHGKLVQLFNKDNGMDKSDIYRGKTYENKLYLLQYEGIQRYDPNTKENYLLSMSDGVESDLDDYVVLNDTIYATNYEGILSFKLDSTLATKTKPKLLLHSFHVNDLETNISHHTTFNHNENNIKINYSLIDYRGIKYTKVYYKLNNSAWVETKAKNKELLFTALEPNKYIIQLKAINYRGYESNAIILQFTILPPFYKTWWFISIIIVIASIIIFIALYRIKLLEKKQKEILEKERMQHELDLSNIKSLRAQMNPHFLYNALNAIQSFIYTGDKETAVTSLGVFSDLSRGVLDSSRSAEISLHDEIALIQNYLKLETMRLPKINYNLVIDPQLNLHDTYLPTMIIQPLIENAIYHGLSNKQGKGLLTINFNLENNKLCVIINDDGIGREAASKLRQRALKKSASFSTSANISRIELLNTTKEHKITQKITDLYQADGSAMGTEVILTIPINDHD